MTEKERKEVIEELRYTEFILSQIVQQIYNIRIAEDFSYETAKQYLEDIKGTQRELLNQLIDLFGIIEETE